MKLSQWVKEQGLTYKGAWRMWKPSQLAVPAEQLPTGTIMVKEIKPRLMRSDSAPKCVRRSKEKIGKHNEAASWFTLATTA